MTHLTYPPPVTSTLDAVQSPTQNKGFTLPEDVAKMLASLAQQSAKESIQQAAGYGADSSNGNYMSDDQSQELAPLSLPPELKQMLSALTQMELDGSSSMDLQDVNAGAPLPANVDMFLNQLKVCTSGVFNVSCLNYVCFCCGIREKTFKQKFFYCTQWKN